MKIQSKFLLTFVPAVVGVTLLLAWSSRQVVRNHLFTEKLSQAEALTRDAVKDTARTINDTLQINAADKVIVGSQLLPQLLSNQYRTGADYEVVMSTAGDVLASTDLALVYSRLLESTTDDVRRSAGDSHRIIESEDGPILDLARPLYKDNATLIEPDGHSNRDDEVVGWLRVGFKLTSIGKTTSKITLGLIYATVAASLLLMALILAPVRRHTKRIRQLSERTKSIGGPRGPGAAPDNRDELAELADNFDVMSRRLEETTISKNYLIDVIESMGDPLIVTTTEGVVRTINRAAERLLGYTSPELLGHSAELLVDEKKFFRVEDLKPIIEDRRISNLELTFLAKNGQKIPVSMSAAPLHDSSGDVVGCVSIAIDLTEKKKIERQMAQSRKLADKSVTQLRELEDMRQNFFSQITHEFRSPLSAAHSLVKMIVQGLYGRVSKKIVEPLVIIQNNNERLTRLVDDLLDASKLDSNAMDLSVGEVDLAACINDVVALFKAMAKEKGITLKTDSLEPLVGWGDHDKVIHILNNLVSNAIKYTRQGGVAISLRRHSQRRAQIVVADTGVGISDEEKGRVFDRFFRTKNGGKVAKGTGLGLYVVKTLAELQKGRVEVSDNPGGGTRFSLFLPLAH